MRQDAKQVRNKILTAIMASVVSIGFITAATAARLSVDTNDGAPAHAQAGTTASTPTGTASAKGNNDVRWGDGVSRLDHAIGHSDEHKPSAKPHKEKV